MTPSALQFLRFLGRDQFDSRQPNYVSPTALVRVKFTTGCHICLWIQVGVTLIWSVPLTGIWQKQLGSCGRWQKNLKNRFTFDLISTQRHTVTLLKKKLLKIKHLSFSFGLWCSDLDKKKCTVLIFLFALYFKVNALCFDKWSKLLLCFFLHWS